MNLELDEYRTDMLKRELERRETYWKNGICYYCGQPLESHSCKLREQINDEAKQRPGVSWHIEEKSSNVSGYGYNKESSVLTVEYKNGVRYDYLNVPFAVYDALTMAESKGRFINEHVKGEFAYNKRLEDK